MLFNSEYDGERMMLSWSNCHNVVVGIYGFNANEIPVSVFVNIAHYFCGLCSGIPDNGYAASVFCSMDFSLIPGIVDRACLRRVEIAPVLFRLNDKFCFILAFARVLLCPVVVLRSAQSIDCNIADIADVKI